MTTTTPTRQQEPARSRRARPSGAARKSPQLGTPARSQRRPFLVALGIALIVVGGLGAWAFTMSMNQTVSVLAVRAEVPRGEVIAETNLAAVEVSEASAGNFLTTQDAADIVGEVAAVDLPAGTVLTTGHLGAPETPQGLAVVGVSLTAAQMPSARLNAGDQILVVATPGVGGVVNADATTIAAEVFAVDTNADAGVWNVDLGVDEADAVTIAQIASTGNVALVLQAGE